MNFEPGSDERWYLALAWYIVFAILAMRSVLKRRK